MLYRGEVSEASLINIQTAFVDDPFVNPKSLKCNFSMINCLIALKFNAGVKYQKLYIQKKSMTRLTLNMYS